MTRRTVHEKLIRVFGDVMEITDTAERRKQMLEVLLNNENICEETRQDARKILDKLTVNKLLDGKGPHDVVLAIIYFCMIKNGDYCMALTPFAQQYGFTPESVKKHYNFIKNCN